MDTFETGTKVSVSERCPSSKESNKGSKERQGPTLSVCFTEVSVKRESTVINLVKVCHPSHMSCWKKTKNWDSKQRKLPF